MDWRSTTNFWWSLSLLAIIGIVVAAPPENDGGCASKPQPEPRFYNSVTKGFYVNGTTLPEVNFDVGESYAGNLPISNKRNESDELFFWFFPTANKEHQDEKEIVIWLSGGVSSSASTDFNLSASFKHANRQTSWQIARLLVNGRRPSRKWPHVLATRDVEAHPNPFSWHLLTNVVWIDQPVGTGFSKGNPSITDEDELAEQFMGFWRNFVDTFGMRGWKVYIAGESWAGMYGPYIASHFIDAKDTEYFDVQGLIIYDGIIFDQTLQSSIAVLPFVTRYQDILPFDGTQLSEFRGIYEACGFSDYFDKYLVFPPSGKQPRLDLGANDGTCAYLWDDVADTARLANPCFNIYNIIDHCPWIYSEGSNSYNLYSGKVAYFNRPDVKKAIHAPPSIDWAACTTTQVFLTNGGVDYSPPSGFEQLPHVINTTQNVILAAGGVDMLVPVNGIVLGIQNMTWGGELGFQYQPQDPFYVPSYGFNVTNNTFTGYGSNSPASSGVLGTTHHERGLTFVATKLSGHQGPGYAPAASFRHLEKLLGRVQSLSGTEPFTLPQLRNISQPDEATLGNGTMPIPSYEGMRLDMVPSAGTGQSIKV